LQLTVEMKGVNLDIGEVEEFLRLKIKGGIESHRTELRIQDARAREVKQLLHKFLHHKGLDIFRVEVVHPGLVQVFGPEHPKAPFVREASGSPPSAGATLPYLFPSSPALAGSPVKKRKKVRK